METLYKKEGKKYIPVLESDYSGINWPEGFSLVYCKPGMTSFRFKIEPDKAAIYAAIRELVEDDLVKEIRNAFSVKPKEKIITEEQRVAWENFVKVMGNDRFAIQYDSIQGIADKILNFIEEKAVLKAKSDVKVLK